MDHDIADRIPSGLVTVDAHDRIVDANSVVVDWIGIDRADLVGREFTSIVRPPPAPPTPDFEYLPAVAEIFRPDGSCLPVLVVGGAPDSNGHRYVTLFDATEQREFRERLQLTHGLTQRTQTRLELVIAASIAFAEATTEQKLAEVLAATTASAYVAEEAVVFLLDDDLVFRQVAGTNPFVGLDDIEVLTERARALRSVLKISGVPAAYDASPAVGKAFESAGVQSIIIAPIRQQDELVGILAAFFHHPREFDEQASPLADALAGQAARAVLGLRFQRQLEFAAKHDDTTGLPNRRLLEEWMDESRRTAAPFLGVLFVDLDGFKGINDRLGHHVGDELLRAVAARLRSAVREDDIVARYGGDEFVIVCEVTSESAAVDLAERVRTTISAPYPTLPSGIVVGASVGISVGVNSAAIGIEQLLRAADQAMYQAKYAGGDRVATSGEPSTFVEAQLSG